MKHYTEFIPKGLALDLQDAGMKIDWEDNSPDEHPNTEVHCLNTYAEVMDWFIENGIILSVDIVNSKYFFERADFVIKHAIKLLEERK